MEEEEDERHLLTVGRGLLTKAKSFYEANNYPETLRCSSLAMKFNEMNKRSLEGISKALAIKCTALQFLCRHEESLECAVEKYKLWALERGPAHPFTIDASFFLIDCLLSTRKYDDAYHYAYTIWEVIHTNNHVDNDIPGEKRLLYVEKSARLLARAIFRLASSGGIPLEEIEKSGTEAIARARQSLEINKQLYGNVSEGVAIATAILADILEYFQKSGDDEIIDLYKLSIDLHRQLHGYMSINVGVNNRNLGITYYNRAEQAHKASNRQQEKINLIQALSYLREAACIYRSINHQDKLKRTLFNVNEVEKKLQQIEVDGIATGGTENTHAMS